MNCLPSLGLDYLSISTGSGLTTPWCCSWSTSYKPLVINVLEVPTLHCSRKVCGGHCNHSCISLHQQIMKSLRAGLWCSSLYEEYEENYITWMKLIHGTALLDMEHISNPNTWEVETRWSRAPVYQVPGQPGLWDPVSMNQNILPTKLFKTWEHSTIYVM